MITSTSSTLAGSTRCDGAPVIFVREIRAGRREPFDRRGPPTRYGPRETLPRQRGRPRRGHHVAPARRACVRPSRVRHVRRRRDGARSPGPGHGGVARRARLRRRRSRGRRHPRRGLRAAEHDRRARRRDVAVFGPATACDSGRTSSPRRRCTPFERVTVTSPLRTMFDLACTLDHDEAVVAVDALAHRYRLDPRQLLAYPAARANPRGGRRIAAVVADADARAESRPETLARLLMRRAGLTPTPQLPVYDDVGRLRRSPGLRVGGLQARRASTRATTTASTRSVAPRRLSHRRLRIVRLVDPPDDLGRRVPEPGRVRPAHPGCRRRPPARAGDPVPVITGASFTLACGIKWTRRS